ncbi:hypothetical protein J2Y42_000784 [Leifsonia sp. 1010]|nr:hypothetical protein [Leifsonia sp. 1010]
MREARAGLRVRAATRPAFAHPLPSHTGPPGVEVHVVAASRGVSSAPTCTSRADRCGMRALGCGYVLQLAPLSRIHSRLTPVRLRRGARNCVRLRGVERNYAHFGGRTCAGCACRCEYVRSSRCLHPLSCRAGPPGVEVHVVVVACGVSSAPTCTSRVLPCAGCARRAVSACGNSSRSTHPHTSRAGPLGVEMHVVATSRGVSSAPTCTSRADKCGMRAPSAEARAGRATRPRGRAGPRPRARRAATSRG